MQEWQLIEPQFSHRFSVVTKLRWLKASEQGVQFSASQFTSSGKPTNVVQVLHSWWFIQHIRVR